MFYLTCMAIGAASAAAVKLLPKSWDEPLITVRNPFRKQKLQPWQEELKYGDFDTAMEMLKRHNAAQDKADGMVCDCHYCKEA